ncbi:MAG: DUF4212 domain-containing protein, partial [Roseiflexaceae bacterium]
MPEAPTTFDWGALLRLIGLWLIVVVLALRVLDLLFPQLRRGDDETQASPLAPPLRRAVGPRPAGLAGQPTPARAAVPASDGAATALDQRHWRSNVRLVIVLLLIWAGVSFVPAALSPLLNRITLLTGFPLGYYMGSQGSLIVFLGLITAYAWRAARLDLRFRSAPWLPGSAREGRAATRRIGLIYVLFTIGFVLFALLMGGLEQQIGLPANVI